MNSRYTLNARSLILVIHVSSEFDSFVDGDVYPCCSSQLYLQDVSVAVMIFCLFSQYS
jgi:hypothetical protein